MSPKKRTAIAPLPYKGLPLSQEHEPAVIAPRIDQIMELAATGRTDKEIAAQLGISKHTVATHWKRLRERLGVTNRASAVNHFLQNRLELQNRQLQEANAELQRLHRARQGEMSTMLSEAQRRIVELEARVKALGFWEHAGHAAHAVAYELQSVMPVAYRTLSTSARHFGMDTAALLRGDQTFYEQIVPEDLAQIYEQTLEAEWLPEERYLFLYRIRMPEPRWILDTHQGFHRPDGELAGVLGIAIDVHDLVLTGFIKPEVTRIVVPATPLSPPS